MNKILLFFAIKYKGDWDQIYNALEKKEKVTMGEISELEIYIKSQNIQYFSILDEDYPEWCKNTYKPPFIIFYKGNKELLRKDNFISLTGDNELMDHHKMIIQNFSSKIMSSFIIVTGLFKGVDEVVANIAIKNEAPLLIISANGLEQPYFSIDQNKFDLSKCLILSEYPSTHVSKERLLARNRLIAAAGKAVVIIASKKDSGVLNLVSNALNLGKEVMCAPDHINLDSGNNELIKQGATLVTNPDEIMETIH